MRCNGGGGVNLREYAEKQAKATQGKPEATADAVKATTPAQLPDRYKRIYRAVYDFHARHTPAPQTPQEWLQVAQEMGSMESDPFLNDLLAAVYNELERQKGVNGNVAD